MCGLAIIIGLFVWLFRKRRRNYRDDFDEMMVRAFDLLG